MDNPDRAGDLGGSGNETSYEQPMATGRVTDLQALARRAARNADVFLSPEAQRAAREWAGRHR